MLAEDYLRSTEKLYCEYRDGAVVPKATSTKPHAIIQYALLLLRAQDVRALPELTVCLFRTKFLILDVCVVSDFPGPYPTEPVLLCKRTAWEYHRGSEPVRSIVTLSAAEIAVTHEELFSGLEAA